MRKISVSQIKRIMLFIISLSIIIYVPFSLFNESGGKAANDKQLLTVWQIDSFEGGKGSRTAYLQNIADIYSENSDCYIVVTSLSYDAVRLNLDGGTVPDLISYGAGTCELESYFTGLKPFYTWCNGGYCILTLDSNSVFKDVTAENTIINEGTGNLSGAAALLCGLSGADKARPTSAYVQLINGKYKYLLGTQRDVFRLKTRGASFSIKAVDEFNDLYQNISVTTVNQNKIKIAQDFIEFLLSQNSEITKIGLMSENRKLYDDEIAMLEGISYKNKLVAPVSQTTKDEINSAIINCDENKLKKLLK